MTGLPDPVERPLLTVDELVALVPRLGRSATYAAIRRGEIPSITYGRKVFVVTAQLRQQWGVDGPTADSGAMTTLIMPRCCGTQWNAAEFAQHAREVHGLGQA